MSAKSFWNGAYTKNELYPDLTVKKKKEKKNTK